MNKKHLRIYIPVSLVHLIFVVCWITYFVETFTEYVYSGIAMILASHLFFWVGYGAPRLGFKMAAEQGRMEQSMLLSQFSLPITILMFGGFGLRFFFFEYFFTGEYGKILFFSLPLSFCIGLYSSWKLARNTLTKKQ